MIKFDAVDCKQKYEIMKDNAETLAKRIDKAIKYIEEYCIDNEFYINLTKKEKNIIYALKILKGEDKE